MKPKTVYVVQFMGRTEWIEDYSVHPCRTKVIAIAAAAEKAKAHPSYKMRVIKRTEKQVWPCGK